MKLLNPRMILMNPAGHTRLFCVYYHPNIPSFLSDFLSNCSSTDDIKVIVCYASRSQRKKIREWAHMDPLPTSCYTNDFYSCLNCNLPFLEYFFPTIR